MAQCCLVNVHVLMEEHGGGIVWRRGDVNNSHGKVNVLIHHHNGFA
jgi:hypothetical protein